METQQTTATEVTDLTGPSIAEVRQRLFPSPLTGPILTFCSCQHLETLRLRLRLARYKIQTNQVNVPFSQLRLSPESVSPQPDLSSPSTIHANTAHEPTNSQSAVSTTFPPSHSAEPRKEQDEVFQTPELPRRLPSSHSYQHLEETTQSPSKLTSIQPILPSSVVRGRAAAAGLLDLRHSHTE